MPPAPPSYVVLAEFRVKDGHAEAFHAYISEHAALSRAEPDCHLFEVARDPADPHHVVLFERYTNEAAYLAHRATAHYARFLIWAQPLLEPSDGSLFLRRSVLQA
jgi:(4S)-4-hydroxy-5-phosphonooxypentane-2,3-dione isomerase